MHRDPAYAQVAKARRTLLLEWLTLLPASGFLPVNSQTRAIIRTPQYK